MVESCYTGARRRLARCVRRGDADGLSRGATRESAAKDTAPVRRIPISGVQRVCAATRQWRGSNWIRVLVLLILIGSAIVAVAVTRRVRFPGWPWEARPCSEQRSR